MACCFSLYTIFCLDRSLRIEPDDDFLRTEIRMSSLLKPNCYVGLRRFSFVKVPLLLIKALLSIHLQVLPCRSFNTQFCLYLYLQMKIVSLSNSTKFSLLCCLPSPALKHLIVNKFLIGKRSDFVILSNNLI